MTDHLAAEKEALRRAADALGGQAALASACGFSDRRSVWPWFNDPKRRVPAEHCPSIERATRAAAAAANDQSKVVTCEELCHDVDWAVLREQAEPVKA
jgi:DNA-binding transcriptional regulator YdaS (Cro superfamily)